MALLEDLIAQVPDNQLRRDLLEAASSVKRQQNFGLVFEEHIPEIVSLPDLPVQVGSRVQRRDRPQDDTAYEVIRLEAETATISPTGDESNPAEEVPLTNLMAVKRFGEPVYPALSSLGIVSRGANKPSHAVINGENYHVLQLLLYMYEEQVDCIYLDPPYNTGDKSWKYNNRFVDDNDQWRHSKWLSFMEKRLRLARRLLRPSDGVLIVTVDEHEVHHLGMLLERLFPSHFHYMVTIVHNPKGTYKKNFSRVDEYAFFVVPQAEEDIINPLPAGMFEQAQTAEQLDALTEEEHEDYYLRRRGQESGFRHQRPNQFYSILVDEETRTVVGVGPELGRDDDYSASERDGSIVSVYPLDTRNDERVWRYSRDTMQKYIQAGEIVVTGYSQRTGQGWVLQHRVKKNPTRRIKTVWWEKRHDAGMHGSDLLSSYLGTAASFPFPKSVYAVRDSLDAVVRHRPNALILDFFAGSGTTYHATCLLNARDGGSRQGVLVTNNEVDDSTARKLHRNGYYRGDPEFERHGIFESVTRPRVEAVTTGLRPDGEPVEGEHVWHARRPYAEGFEENVEFFQLTYHDPDDIDLGCKFQALLPVLWLTGGGIGPRDDADGVAYSVPEGSTYAVLFDEAAFRAFRDKVTERNNLTHVFLVTDSSEAYAEMRSQLPSHLTTSMLYEDYIRHFRINTERNG